MGLIPLIIYLTCLSTVEDHAFSVAGPHVWKSLPQHVTSAPSLPFFFNLSENASFPYLGILCAWTTTQMPRGSCWPPSGRLEKTTGSSPHHMAQHHPTRSETSPSYAPQSSRFGSEPPSVEDDVDVWHYATVSCMPETTTHLSVHCFLYHLPPAKEEVYVFARVLLSVCLSVCL